MNILLALLLGHFVADYALQSDWIAKHKNRHVPLTPTQWPWILTAHAATHAFFVLYITHSVWLALAELVAHWGIDFAKCEGRTTIHQDQVAHLLCKLAWWAILLNWKLA